MCEKTARILSLREEATKRFGEGNPNVDSFMDTPYAAMGGVTPSQAAEKSDNGLSTARALLLNAGG